MKPYPSIPHVSEKHLGLICYSFVKYDGSNLRFEYSRKQGWYKFGTRHRLFDRQDPEFGGAIQVFLDRLAEPVERMMRDFNGNPESFMAFCEFLGPHSFAGQHDPQWLNVESNEPKELVLIDVSVYKRGMLDPRRFVELFGGQQHVAQCLDFAPLTDQYVIDVRSGKIVPGEGVILKGGEGHGFWMAKIKTEQYLDRLRSRFGTDWKKYE